MPLKPIFSQKLLFIFLNSYHFVCTSLSFFNTFYFLELSSVCLISPWILIFLNLKILKKNTFITSLEYIGECLKRLQLPLWFECVCVCLYECVCVFTLQESWTWSYMTNYQPWRFVFIIYSTAPLENLLKTFPDIIQICMSFWGSLIEKSQMSISNLTLSTKKVPYISLIVYNLFKWEVRIMPLVKLYNKYKHLLTAMNKNILRY